MAIEFVKDETRTNPDMCDCCKHDSERWEGEELHIMEVKMGSYLDNIKQSK